MRTKRDGLDRRHAIITLAGAISAMVLPSTAFSAFARHPLNATAVSLLPISSAGDIRATSAEDYVRQFVMQNFSDLPGTLGDDVVTAYCKSVVACCAPLEITEWKDMGWYAFMGLILGLHFHRDPQWLDIPAVMSDLSIAPGERIYRCYQVLRTNINQVAGEDFSYAKKAFVLLAFYQITEETADLAESDDACLDELAKLWQQKADLIRSVRERYFAAARKEARDAGFTGHLDGALFGFIGAYAGLGFYNDPVCGWVRTIIDTHRKDTVRQRFVLSLQEIQRYGFKKKLFG